MVINIILLLLLPLLLVSPIIIVLLQLIQRLYDLESGDLSLENEDLASVNLPWLRSKLGIVSQV